MKNTNFIIKIKIKNFNGKKWMKNELGIFIPISSNVKWEKKRNQQTDKLL